MTMSGTADFVVRTQNRCFLCLSEVRHAFTRDHDYINKSSSSATHSIQHLANFLKLDKSKIVLGDSGNKVEQSNLMVELCEECAPLHESLSELLQQLEKIRLEVLTKLSLFQGKLLKVTEVSPDIRDVQLNGMDCDDAMNPNTLNRKRELANRLREEVIQKCALKLRSAERPVKLEDLPRNGDVPSSATHASPRQNVIVEPPSQILSISEDFGPRIMKVESLKIENDQGAVLESSLVVAPPNQVISLKSDSGPDPTHDHPVDVKEEEAEELDEMEIVIGDGLQAEQQDLELEDPLAIPTPAPAVAPRGENPLGDPVDAQVKFQCESCHKSFTTRSSCRIHFETAHLGVRFKCPGQGCSKTFSQRSHLQFHRLNSCGRRGRRPNHYCEICGNGLANKNNLHQHLRLIHSRLRDLPCDLCEKQFYTENEVKDHRRKKHGAM